MNFTYASFAGRENKTSFEQMTGIYKRVKDSYFSSFEDQLTFQNKDFKVLVDKYAQEIIVTKPTSMNPTELDQVIYSATLDKVKQFSKRASSGITEYRMLYDGSLEYESSTLEFDKKMMLKRIIYQYRDQQELDRPDGSKYKEFPRLELSISNYSKQVTLLANEKVESVIKTNGNSVLSTTEEYKNFRLNDYTK
jgi:DNA mismatch repair ATPase MutS